METSNGALINRRRTKLHYQPRCLYSPIISHCQELPEYLVRCQLRYWHEKPHKISNFSGNGDPASWSLVPDSVIILPKTQPFCPFSMENFPCCTLLGILTRFIFMGNQPFFDNGESNGGCQALPAGALHAPLVIHLSRDPRWRCQWRIY